MNKTATVGIVGYGAYMPHYYIDPAEINVGARSLGLTKKALAVWDEDSVTMAVEAGNTALEVAGVEAHELGAVYVGSESPPYAVNPMSTIVADVLGVANKESGLGEYRAVDLQFACKAATAGLQMAMGEVQGGHHDYALVIGSDKAQAKPGDVLEWSAGAAAAALLVGRERVIAEVKGMVSVTSDTPDFWRRAYEQHPQHGGRFSGEPAYFNHVLSASELIMKRLALKPGDITYAVFHMPNGRFPLEVARKLGFEAEQVEPFFTVKEVGNPYSASALMGLVAVLEKLKAGETVLVTAYGSGAGADAMILEGTDELKNYRWGGLDDLFKKRQQVGLLAYRERERWE
jgi:hydroxymethylglutaryl-CoA synthase